MDKQLAFAEFWTLEEIAEYIIRIVNQRKPLDVDIIKEWNKYMANMDFNRNE